VFLYNAKKKCIAVDDDSARALGYASSTEFLEEAGDVAQFFINRPGYVYDFKNFSWIDYIIFNPGKEHRVIIPTSLGEIDTAISVRRLKDREGRDFFAVVLKEIDGLDVSSTFMYEEAQEGGFAQGLSEAPTLEYEEPETPYEEPAAPKEPQLREEPKVQEEPEVQLGEPQPEPAAETATPEDEIALYAPSQEPVEESVAPKERDKEPSISISSETLAQMGLSDRETEEEPRVDVEPVALRIEEEEPEVKLFGAQEPREVAVSKEPAEPLPQVEYDLEAVAEELEIDEELIKELVEEFLQQAHEMEPEIYEALETKDLQRAKDLIHKIKGAVANLRIKSADEILAQTSEVTDFGRLREIMDQFYTHLRGLEHHLHERYGIAPVAPAAGEAAPEPAAALSAQEESLATEESGTQDTREQDVQISIGLGDEAAHQLQDKEISIGLGPEEEESSVEPVQAGVSIEPLAAQEAESPQEAPAASFAHEVRIEPGEIEPHEAEPELDLLADVMETKPTAAAEPEAATEPRQEMAAAPEAPLQPEATAGAEQSGIDVERMMQKAVEELGISREDVEEFVRDYIFRAINFRPLIERLVKNGSKEELRNAIHKLKGTALNLRLEPLAKALEEFSAGDTEALERFYRTIEALKEGLGVEVVQTLDQGVLERNAMELGIDPQSYREIVQEYMDQLQEALQKYDGGISSDEIHKLISVGENLRLGMVTTLLEGVLENKEKREYFLKQLRELIERYKGAV